MAEGVPVYSGTNCSIQLKERQPSFMQSCCSEARCFKNFLDLEVMRCRCYHNIIYILVYIVEKLFRVHPEWYMKEIYKSGGNKVNNYLILILIVVFLVG